MKQQIIAGVIIEFVGGGCLGCSECSGRVLIAISTHTWCWSGGLDILNFVFDTFGKSFIDILRMTILVILLTRCVNNFCPTPKASESSCCPKVSMSILRWRTGRYLGHISPWSITTQDTAERCGALSGPSLPRLYTTTNKACLTSQSCLRIIK